MTTPNPNPSPTGIEDQVCQDIADRQQRRQKYRGIQDEDLLEHRLWLQRAYEEALELAIYLKRALSDLPPAPPIIPFSWPPTSTQPDKTVPVPAYDVLTEGYDPAKLKR